MAIPKTFSDQAKFTEQHATSFLEKYGHLLTWKSDEKELIADIGCANGVITTDILLPFYRSKIREIIGLDISSAMIESANSKNKEPNVSFLEMDASKKQIDADFVEKFDHIFSFYCLHMISDQRQFAENLYKMLKPGGEAFLTCLIRGNMIQAWFDLCEYDKWAPYFGDFPKKFSGYQTSDHPQVDFVEVFAEAGFTVEAYVEPRTQVFDDREEFERFNVEMNMLIGLVPERLKDRFSKDLLQLIYGGNGDTCELIVEVLVGVVRKPLT